MAVVEGDLYRLPSLYYPATRRWLRCGLAAFGVLLGVAWVA